VSASASRRRELDAAVGLMIFLGAVAMLFAALLLAYAVVRTQAIAWPPPGTPALPRGAAAANGLLLIAVSVALRGAARRRGLTLAALALGVGFLIAQVALWRHLVAQHLGPGAGAFGDVFFALSALHGLHVGGGLIALATAAPPAAPARRLRLTTIYWDFLLVVWLVVYVAVCLA
jgi:cytochrome c oxidase subunit 3